MRREHLERLSPICPACSASGREPGRLALGAVAAEDGGDVREGVLVCEHAECRREHPIVDGIPIVVAHLPSWAEHQLESVLRRDGLSPLATGLLGDAAQPGSAFDRDRQNLSGYGHAHWEGGFAELTAQALDLLDSPPRGVWADLGCATGRGTLELARRTGDLAVGVDLSFAMLRVAEGVRRTGRATYPRKRIGAVYDHRDIPVPDVPAECMSFWCADVTALPFAPGAFAGALSLNVLDCVQSPYGHLLELDRVTAGDVLLSTPYDWSPTATAIDQWLGGHSQRAPHGGDGPPELRRVAGHAGRAVTAERDGVPWRVYANARSSVEYALHLVRLSPLAAPPPPPSAG